MMELYKEILAHILAHEEICITFPNLHTDAAAIAEQRACRALQKIRDVMEDDRFDDTACFMKIEEIVALFDAYGGCEGRHDWG